MATAAAIAAAIWWCCRPPGRGDRRVALGRRLEGRQGGRDGPRNGRVGLGHAVAVAGQAQGEVIVLEADAQRRVEMEIAQGWCPAAGLR